MSEGWLHASALGIDGRGVLVRGASKSGKSALTLALIEAAHAQGRQARLIGDDRVRLERRGAQLMLLGHPAIAGQIEVRGIGIAMLPFAPEVPLQLVVDLIDGAPQHNGQDVVELSGLRIQRLSLGQRQTQFEVLMKILEKIA